MNVLAHSRPDRPALTLGMATGASGIIGLLPKWLVHLVALVAAFDALGLPAQSKNQNGAEQLQPFIAPGGKLLAFALADLNGDGLEDAVFIVEQKPSSQPTQAEPGQRLLKIAIRLPNGALELRKTSDKAIYCATCGGVNGDPFAGLQAGRNAFSVHHQGGSTDRWASTFRFAYSRKDDTWQLVLVEEETFGATDPRGKRRIATYRPPTSFGKIDISQFDPQHFKGVGPR